MKRAANRCIPICTTAVAICWSCCNFPTCSAMPNLEKVTRLGLYERGRVSRIGEKSSPDAGIAVARFNLQWLTDGQDSLPAVR